MRPQREWLHWVWGRAARERGDWGRRRTTNEERRAMHTGLGNTVMSMFTAERAPAGPSLCLPRSDSMQHTMAHD